MNNKNFHDDLPRFERIHHPKRHECPRRAKRSERLTHNPRACAHKTGYGSRQRAWMAANSRGECATKRVYLCDACRRWHITTWTSEQNEASWHR